MSSTQKVIKYCAMGFAAFLAISIAGGILTAVISLAGCLMDIPFHGDGDFEVGNYNAEKVYTGIDSLKLNCGLSSVTVETDNKLEGIRIVYDGEKEYFNVSQNGDLLRLEEKSRGWGKFLKKHPNKTSKIKILIPPEKVFDKVEVDAGVGSLNMNSIICEKLDIDCGVGNVEGINIKAEKADIDGGVGNIVLKDVEFEGLDVDGGVGDIEISGNLFGNTDVSTGMGDAELNIKGNRDDYNIKVDSGVGSVRVDGEKCGDINLRNSDADNKLDIDGGVGSIGINFVG